MNRQSDARESRSRTIPVWALTLTSIAISGILAGCDLNGMSMKSSTANSGSVSAASPAETTGPSQSTTPAAASNVTLSWTPPLENTDGSMLTDLAGYRILYGNSANNLNRTVNIPVPGVTAYVIEGLAAGTWYFAVRAFSAAGIESALSPTLGATIG